MDVEAFDRKSKIVVIQGLRFFIWIAFTFWTTYQVLSPIARAAVMKTDVQAGLINIALWSAIWHAIDTYCRKRKEKIAEKQLSNKPA